MVTIWLINYQYLWVINLTQKQNLSTENLKIHYSLGMNTLKIKPLKPKTTSKCNLLDHLHVNSGPKPCFKTHKTETPSPVYPWLLLFVSFCGLPPKDLVGYFFKGGFQEKTTLFGRTVEWDLIETQVTLRTLSQKLSVEERVPKVTLVGFKVVDTRWWYCSSDDKLTKLGEPKVREKKEGTQKRLSSD